MNKSLKWSKIYDEYFPDFTDGASRHVKMIAENMRSKKDGIGKMLDTAGYEPEHMAESMEITVIALWKARKRIAELEKEKRNED